MDWVLNPTPSNLPQYALTMDWVVLGKEVLQKAVYDGEAVVTEAVYGDAYLVDVVWRDGKERPTWAQYRVEPKTPDHYFFGLMELYHKNTSETEQE